MFSPLSLALQTSRRFSVFRTVLLELSIDLLDFVHEATDYINNGWTEDTLKDLFLDRHGPYDGNSDMKEIRTCENCRRGSILTQNGEAPWSLWLQRIKEGKRSIDPLTEDELKTKQLWESYVENHMTHGICIDCHHIEQDCNILGDDEDRSFSPYLLHT